MEPQSTEAAFRAIWVAPSIILGLGITRLCSDAVSLFRSRHRARIDWIPLLWAACIFVWQIQYLWAIIELPHFVRTWTLPEFLMLLGLSLALFVAAALVFPDNELRRSETLEEDFLRDGRWALAALSAWGYAAVLVDVRLFAEPLLSPDVGLMIVVATVPLLYLATRTRRLRALITVGNLPLTLWAAWVLSPNAY